MHLCTILVIDSTLILVDVLYFSDLYWKQAWEKNILKEIKLGLLVAFESKAEIPKIGEVSHIPPNPTLQSMINVILYEEDGATHKPS